MTPLWKDAPLAPAIFVPRVNQPFPWEWRVIVCPYCGDEHRHHSGINEPLRGDDPRAYLGGRKAHCYFHVDHPFEIPAIEYRLVPIVWKNGDLKELGGFFPRAKNAISAHGRFPYRIERVALGEVIPHKLARDDGEIRRTFSPEMRSFVFGKTNGHCVYCGVQIDPFLTFHIDHLHPISRGGSNDPDNLLPACKSCNSSKSARSIEEFRRQRGGGLFWFEREGIEL